MQSECPFSISLLLICPCVDCNELDLYCLANVTVVLQKCGTWKLSAKSVPSLSPTLGSVDLKHLSIAVKVGCYKLCWYCIQL